MKRRLPLFFALLNMTMLNAQVDFIKTYNLDTGDKPSSAVLTDLDGDGQTDLAVLNTMDNTISLYQNVDTDGVPDATDFSSKGVISTSDRAGHLTSADIDGDGQPELITTDSDFFGFVSVYHNKNNTGMLEADSFATQVDFQTFSGSAKTVVADFDGDGKLDLAVSNANDLATSVLRNTSTPGQIDANSFANPAQVNVSTAHARIETADFDADGKMDFVVDSDAIRFMRNESSPGQLDASSFTEMLMLDDTDIRAFAFGDLNQDGLPDMVYTLQNTSGINIRFNTSTGSGNLSFDPNVITIGTLVNSNPSLVDFDADGLLDIAAVDVANQQLVIYENTWFIGDPFNEQSMTFVVDFPTGMAPTALSTGFIYSTNFPDLVLLNRNDNDLTVFFNNTLILSTKNLPVQGLQLYPNPFQTDLFIDFTNEQEPVEIQIQDAWGRIHLQRELRQSQWINLPVNWAKGWYVLLVRQGEAMTSKRIFKQ